MKAVPVQPRRKYDKTFKFQAVENWIRSGKSAEVIGQELGIAANRLYAWRSDFGPPAAGGGERRGGQSLGPWPTCNPDWRRPNANWPTFGSSATF